jgi:hypothetical protein
MPAHDCELLAEVFFNENPATCSAKKIAFAGAHYRKCEKCRTRFATMGNLSEWQDHWGDLERDDTKGWGIFIAGAGVLFLGALAAWYFMR